MVAMDAAVPDYTRQLEQLIRVLGQKDAIPGWAVSLISTTFGVVLGSLGTFLVGMAKAKVERRDRAATLERSLYVELVHNYAALHVLYSQHGGRNDPAGLHSGLTSTLDFDRYEYARSHPDVMVDVPACNDLRFISKVHKTVAAANGTQGELLLMVKIGMGVVEQKIAEGALKTKLLLSIVPSGPIHGAIDAVANKTIPTTFEADPELAQQLLTITGHPR